MKDAPSQVRSPRTGELVAAKLRKQIITGELQDGDEIAPEPELMAEYGVSRPSIRDAIRILETEGLLKIRRGRFGGANVVRPTPASAAYHLGLVMQAEGTTLADLAEARGVLEPLCAGLCASRHERERIADELDAIIAESVPAEDDDEGGLRRVHRRGAALPRRDRRPLRQHHAAAAGRRAGERVGLAGTPLGAQRRRRGPLPEPRGPARGRQSAPRRRPPHPRGQSRAGAEDDGRAPRHLADVRLARRRAGRRAHAAERPTRASARWAAPVPESAGGRRRRSPAPGPRRAGR